MNPLSAPEVRQRFLDFFRQKAHDIVPSAPMVLKDDPTLLFTNAGMNPFKDIFLGAAEAKHPRVADSQKCLRVSGKHNDLEEVGKDTYHHTFFEMLGNWSFGDYFKKEAIAWAWEFLVEEMKVEVDRLYATVFEGDEVDGLAKDEESAALWKQFLPEDRILNGSKKDNFWEMGETGPCGPCSEIHVDLRTAEERKAISGRDLVNQDHPQVIEIWNLVFMEFNRKADGSLELLPAKHVDTGMGFERLVRVLQGKSSNYDSDVFTPFIQWLEIQTQLAYGKTEAVDIAMRVIADHVRAVSFSIADGQLPSNTGAGYVIRRILRRAIRYGYTFLHQEAPFIYRLTEVLVNQMGSAYPELVRNSETIHNVILEEEKAFLRTLASGIQRIQTVIEQQGNAHLDGQSVFELYDTYGFPVDLTQLIVEEREGSIDLPGFHQAMEVQKTRSRAATQLKAGDWIIIEQQQESAFVGYDKLETQSPLLRYRVVKAGKKEQMQLVFAQTPFYPEGGGQIGDQGWLTDPNGSRHRVVDTRKETGLLLHITEVAEVVPGTWTLEVDANRRQRAAAHHSATHLLHEALREVLGSHVEQKGSLVAPDYLRFDFSHFSKVEPEDLQRIEEMVNHKVWSNLSLQEHRDIPIDEAKSMGAMALFGEKYGDRVRAIQFGSSIELCGGTHVRSTGAIGLFRIVSEASVASGIRRIEAVSSEAAYQLDRTDRQLLDQIGELLKQPKDLLKAVEQLQGKLQQSEKELHAYEQSKAEAVFKLWQQKIDGQSGLKVLLAVEDLDANQVKNLLFRWKNANQIFAAVGGVNEDKPHLSILISEDLVAERGWNAGQLIRNWAKGIQGGGGGQAFLATAGGKDPKGLEGVMNEIEQWTMDNA